MEISEENKKFLRKVSIIAMPIILQDLLNNLINMADTFMIGTLGEDAITAVALGNQIFFLFILFVFGINSGSSVFMSQYWGAKDKKSIHKTMGISVISSEIVAICFMLLAIFIPEKLLIIYTRDAEVLKIGADYLRIVAFVYPLYALSLPVNIANRSTGNTKFPMFTTIIALVTNCTLNYIFIFKLNLGVQGAALGTLIARTLEVTAQFFLIAKFKLPILGKPRDYFSAKKDFIKEYYRRALPVIGNEVMWAAGVTLYMVAYGFVTVSESPQASIQIANTIRQIFSVIGIGIGSAGGVIIGNLLGANQIDKAKVYAKKLSKLVFGVTVVMSALVFITAPYVLSLFNVSDAVRHDTIIILRIIAFIMLFSITNYLNIVGILRAGGDTFFCLVLDAGSVWFCGVPLAFLAAIVFDLPIYWVFLAAGMEEVSKYFFAVIRVKSNRWAVNIIDSEKKEEVA